MADDTIALTSVEAARELRCSVQTLLKWVAAGKCPAVRIGTRKWLFSREEIRKLVAGNKTEA